MIDLTKDLEALKDQLEKKLIDQEFYEKQLKNLDKMKMTFILATNGGYSAPTRNKGRKAAKIAELREKAAIERVRDFVKKQDSVREALPTEPEA